MNLRIYAPEFMNMPYQLINVNLDGFYDTERQTFVIESIKYKGEQIDVPCKMTFNEILNCKKSANANFCIDSRGGFANI